MGFATEPIPTSPHLRVPPVCQGKSQTGFACPTLRRVRRHDAITWIDRRPAFSIAASVLAFSGKNLAPSPGPRPRRAV